MSRVLQEDSPEVVALVSRTMMRDRLRLPYERLVEVGAREELAKTSLEPVAIEAAIRAQVSALRPEFSRTCRRWAVELLAVTSPEHDQELVKLLKDHRVLVPGFCHWMRPTDGLSVASSLFPELSANALYQWRLRFKRRRHLKRFGPGLVGLLGGALVLSRADPAEAREGRAFSPRKKRLAIVGIAIGSAGVGATLAPCNRDRPVTARPSPRAAARNNNGSSVSFAGVTATSPATPALPRGAASAQLNDRHADVLNWLTWPGVGNFNAWGSPSGWTYFLRLSPAADGSLAGYSLNGKEYCEGAADASSVIFYCPQSTDGVETVLVGWREETSGIRSLRGNGWQVEGMDHDKLEPLAAWVYADSVIDPDGKRNREGANSPPVLARWYEFDDGSAKADYERLCRDHMGDHSRMCSGLGRWSFPDYVADAGLVKRSSRSARLK